MRRKRIILRGEKMIFERINEKYLEEAVKLAQTQYNMEQEQVEALQQKDYSDILYNLLSSIFSNKYGAVALEHGKLIGYLGFWGGIDGFFGNVKGAFSPLFANAVQGENRGRTMSLLFQHASEEMVKNEILSIGICIYSHDTEVMSSLIMNGFGARCSDAVRNIDKAIGVSINKEYFYEEINYSEAGILLPLKNSLVRHLRQSPTYFPNNEFSAEKFSEMCRRRKSRFFIARNSTEVIGYIEIMEEGETFISEEPDMLNICGAYLKEGYRGENIFQSLLSYALEALKKDGVKRIGVDCETINPNAFRFWRKYFDTYTYSFVRRIDERVLE